MQFNEALKNLLLPYAKGIFLDILGALFGTPRLSTEPANTTLQFNLYEIFSFNKTIIKGTQVETSDGEYIFVTDSDLVIPAGATVGTVSATSVLGGALLNRYKEGEITGLLDNLAFVESVTNITPVAGGADDEEDEPYRERLYLAPSSWSVAGPEDAYKFYARSAHKDVKDVSVIVPQLPAHIKIGENIYTESRAIYLFSIL
jgi:phage-related baseplate assembly protein